MDSTEVQPAAIPTTPTIILCVVAWVMIAGIAIIAYPFTIFAALASIEDPDTSESNLAPLDGARDEEDGGYKDNERLLSAVDRGSAAAAAAPAGSKQESFMVTTRVKSTLRYLKKDGGKGALFRGIVCAAHYAVFSTVLSAVFLVVLPLSKGMAAYVGALFTAVILAPIDMIQTQIMVSPHEKTTWFGRLRRLPLREVKPTVIPTLLLVILNPAPLCVYLMPRHGDIASSNPVFSIGLMLFVIFFFFWVIIPMRIMLYRYQVACSPTLTTIVPTSARNMRLREMFRESVTRDRYRRVLRMYAAQFGFTLVASMMAFAVLTGLSMIMLDAQARSRIADAVKQGARRY